MRAVIHFVTLLTFACFATASVLNADITGQPYLNPRRLHPSYGLDFNGLFHARKLSRMQNGVQGGDLLESNANVCAWDEEAGQCFLSAGTVLDFLSQVDNPLSNYLHRAISCELQSDADDCKSEGCAWNGFDCNIHHEDFEEFTSAWCLKDARHIVEMQAMYFECSPKRREADCQATEFCIWDVTASDCALDYWFFYHGIPSTTEGQAEGFTELYDERENQFREYIDEARTDGNITNAGDILELELSEFECPSKYDPALCEFVDALAPVMLTELYCADAYPSVDEESACSLDDLCRTTFLGPCEAAVSVYDDAYEHAYRRLNKHIDDPATRRYDQQDTNCLYTQDPKKCKKNCVWRNRSCRLSPQWAEREAYRLIDETNNRVCQFYRSDVETGCLDHETVESCTEDRQCVWLHEFNSCEAGLYAWMDIALRGSEVMETFKAAEDLCFGSPFEECIASQNDDGVGSIVAEDEWMLESESTHTDLTSAIGADHTIYSVLF